MFYFLHGDIPKAVDKANQMVEAMLKKQPDASRFKLDSENFSRSGLQELLGSQGLFSSRYIVDLRRLLENKENKNKEGEKDEENIIFEFLKELKESPNIFIWVEEDVKASDLKKIEKYAEKVQSFYFAQNKEKKPVFNIFSLGDFLGERDKKKLWVGYIDALNYFAVEEIHRTLFWQIKNMLLASKSSSVLETDLKPFVFNKAKSFSKNYSKEELEKISSDLVSISHDAKRGKHDLKIALERFCLGV